MAAATRTNGQGNNGGGYHENVTVGPDGIRYRTAKEGLARIYVPLSDGEKMRQNGGGGPAAEDHPQQVFYNPIQQFNRDLSVLTIKAYGRTKLEERAARFAKRKEVFADKKRRMAAEKEKRKREDGEKPEGERPAKMGKAEEDAAEVTIRGPAPREGEAEAVEAGAAADTAEVADATDAAVSVPPIRILDALSATGLRALRYAHELPFPVAVTANDLLEAATESIRRNIELNGLTDKITATQSDAIGHMYTVVATELANSKGPSQKYDVVDLDPYGSAAAFFDAAVQSVRNDGGLLCVTCTDPGVWASQGYPEKCFSLYGGVPMKGLHSHEAGLRIILHGLAAAAARYGLAVTPQLSLSIDFYCRVFVTVRRSPASVKFTAGRTMVAFNCDHGCGAWTLQPLLLNRATPNKKGSGVFYKHSFAAGPRSAAHCEHCHSKTHMAGPMYAGPIHSAAFIRRILNELPDASREVYGTTDRIQGMLQTALEELAEDDEDGDSNEGDENNGDDGEGKQYGREQRPKRTAEEVLAELDPMPFFFSPSNLAKTLHCQTPHEDAIRGALLRLGYRSTRSHCRPGSIKTDAPWTVLWHVMREWVRQKAPVKAESIRPGSVAERLLRMGSVATEESTETAAEEMPKVVFDEQLARQRGRGGRLVRYQANPRENWGPMNRAKGH